MIRILACCTAIALAAGVAHAQSGLKPPAQKSKPAASAKKPASTAKKPAAEGMSEGEKAVHEIFACLAAGLPEGWRRAWVVVTEIAGDDKTRSFEGRFFYSLDPEGAQPATLVPCDAREAARRVYDLNEFLEPAQRRWKAATLTYTREGDFQLKYDYDQ